MEGEKKSAPPLTMPGRRIMVDSGFKKARFSSDNKYVLDKDGKKLHFNDPRVIHVWAMETNYYFIKIV